jgi:pyruvate dehydrogenase E2 component (dihydrolipoamide acetyltransferase)
MAVPVEVPKLGNTVEECILARWQKKKGDLVSAGDGIAEIETDKATFELTAPVGGTILELFFEEGALVPVFTTLCVIGKAGESVEAFRPGASSVSGPATPAAISVQRVEQRKVAPEAPVPSPARIGVLSPRARRFAEEHSFHPASVAGSGPDGRVLEEDLRKLYHLSPRVSGLAREQIRDGAEVRGEGSGTGGMILSSDLGSPGTRISHLRERIARRMRESLSSSAQYTLNATAGAAGLLAVRAKVKATPGSADININDLVVFCTVKALQLMPELNADFRDGKIYQHKEIHMGFACDTPRGLMVPVIRDAHRLSIAELALAAKELSTQAVTGTISADSLSGGTFTVSNLGGLGIESFTPLINPPQVAVLGVGTIRLRPIRVNGKVDFEDAICLSLTCDHQVIDGAPGARFLNVLKEQIEKVESLCTI